MRCRVICKEYYTLYVCILFRYTAQFCSTLAAKFPIDIGGIRSVLEFFISSVAGRNFPRAHTKDYSNGPPQDICRAQKSQRDGVQGPAAGDAEAQESRGTACAPGGRAGRGLPVQAPRQGQRCGAASRWPPLAPELSSC